MSSTDSSEDEGNVYVNAASRLNALKRRANHKFPDKKDLSNDDDDDGSNDEIIEKISESPKKSKLSAKSKKENTKTTSDNSLIVIEESSTEPVLVEDDLVATVLDDDVVMCIEDSEEEEESNVRRSKRNLTRKSSKRVKSISPKKKPKSTRKNTDKNSNKQIGAISAIIELEKDSFNDSIERELNKSFNDSFLDLSQDENESEYLLIGSPPPAKKCDSDNYEVSVKVLWRSNKIERFELRRFETFQKIFRHFSEVEQVPEDQIIITKESKRITPYETPASINWSIIDILEGGIVSAEIAKMNKGQPSQNGEQENVCKIKIQTSDKRTLTVTLKLDESFSTLVNRCVEELNIPESKMKFYFDGELIDTDETPESLDIDDEACIDLKISK